MKTRTTAFLMANLGSDISQLFSHIENGEARMVTSAAQRAGKIIAELLAHEELEGRTKEIEILRDIIDDALSGKRLFDVNKNDMEDYFMPFSIRVLRQTL
ncbi:MAG: hypothetical protein A2W52_02355 [Candidatus Taylorbacteria bacterium RIFCSPHIGHO2_02_49_25]|uniref:Uncharacterized protein n=1 Tax=Candidatus Taylorbacteria bacterium RIFCSPHIGHO2_02_49_25 TaxID=1802305 RepID=A0A1G2MJS3_9BACT|nr:MAG: hypothetical protein UY62_C0001G0032 [Parcubacteria group bacterium GW2011_GWF2_50_9]OHA19288.1 MAG: hypothetical protein A2759_03275 [Candidatus Taylorbacteria bacterium RIFCSPHIGHO2_01_FULL_49_60]OHA23242.1 MAG: hypothetical protein A2W52_02355 [Candidatus Taylorbacteria bacterium RIFCSPHIGHO2_02_49_25]OHA35552.1 MAG: hypothetical protein A2W65_00635 [Candidatus Taylorbacteria bacterium RIFCSPLOWO2_02_50_13]OHA46350.1 MAG: hypothetical protein A3G61_01930 [Candidatus Taylorbacteria ba